MAFMFDRGTHWAERCAGSGTSAGSILFSDDIRLNSSHRERTYQSYQVFGTDRAENRLIRAALRYLRTLSCDYGNRREVRRLLPYFNGCSDIGDVDAELRGCVLDRNMKHYSRAVRWCDVFLHGRTLSMFSGSEVAYSFLFPMEPNFA
jgi:5-methylcytosine-specific restriction enzyme subunit McrC